MSAITGVSGETEICVYDKRNRIFLQNAGHIRVGNEVMSVGFHSCMYHRLQTVTECHSSLSPLLEIICSNGAVLKCAPAQRVLKYTGNVDKMVHCDAEDPPNHDVDETLQVEMVAAETLAVGDFLAFYARCSDNCADFFIASFHEYGENEDDFTQIETIRRLETPVPVYAFKLGEQSSASEGNGFVIGDASL